MLMKCLADMATSKEAPDRAKAYWNTWHCQNRVVSAGGRLYGKYCKNRFCTVCSSIRKAEIINKYLPTIKTWPDPHFVTLTSKAVPAKWLKGRVSNLLRAFKILMGRYKKRGQRGEDICISGIRSLECNFNPIARTYNPHLHLIVPSKEIAELLLNDWLALWGKKFTNRAGQLAKKVSDWEKSLIEVVKYGTKIFTDPTMPKKKALKPKMKVTSYVYISAFDNIIAAMSGHRIFDRFGFNLPKVVKQKGGKATKTNDYKQLIFDPQKNDWVDPETEELLSGYEISPELRAIFEGYIDMELQ